MKITATFLILSLNVASPAIAEGDPEAGERIYRQCSSCHSLEGGQRRSGPSLYGIVGAEAGAVEGFRYSDANLNAGIVWDENNLAAFLADPRGFMPGTRMSFRGLRDEQDIADLIAFLMANEQ